MPKIEELSTNGLEKQEGSNQEEINHTMNKCSELVVCILSGAETCNMYGECNKENCFWSTEEAISYKYENKKVTKTEVKKEKTEPLKSTLTINGTQRDVIFLKEESSIKKNAGNIKLKIGKKIYIFSVSYKKEEGLKFSAANEKKEVTTMDITSEHKNLSSRDLLTIKQFILFNIINNYNYNKTL